MAEVINTLTLSEQIVLMAPEICIGCDAAFAKSCALGRKVLDGQLELEEAQYELLDDLSLNCHGKIPRHQGWGELKYACTYEAPATAEDLNVIG